MASEGSLRKGERWLIGVVLSSAIGGLVPLIGFQWRQSLEVTKTTSSIDSMQKSLEKLTNTVENLMQNDVADLKQRILVIEQKQILPKFERDIADLSERVGELEKSVK